MHRWWLLVPALGLLEFAGQRYFSGVAPTADEWRVLADDLGAVHQEGDLVVVAPYWAEPNARHALGDAKMPLAHLARPDESTFARAIEVSVLGHHADELAGWSVAEERRAGDFLLRVLQNPAPATVVYDFVGGLGPDGVRVETGEGNGRKPCAFRTNAPVTNGTLQGHPTFPAHRFMCPGGGQWHFVGVTVIEDQRYRPRRCIWSHPPKRGPIVTRFEDVPLGRVIRGYAGIPWYRERHEAGKPVELRVTVGGTVLGTYVHEDGDGWAPFEFPLREHAGKRGVVEFEVSAPPSKDREFCFQADSR